MVRSTLCYLLLGSRGVEHVYSLYGLEALSKNNQEVTRNERPRDDIKRLGKEHFLEREVPHSVGTFSL